jgi:hypothetical protein
MTGCQTYRNDVLVFGQLPFSLPEPEPEADTNRFTFIVGLVLVEAANNL